MANVAGAGGLGVGMGACDGAGAGVEIVAGDTAVGDADIPGVAAPGVVAACGAPSIPAAPHPDSVATERISNTSRWAWRARLMQKIRSALPETVGPGVRDREFDVRRPFKRGYTRRNG